MRSGFQVASPLVAYGKMRSDAIFVPPDPNHLMYWHSDDLRDCGYLDDATCDCTCVEGGGDLKCGSGTGYDCVDPDSSCGEQTRFSQYDTKLSVFCRANV